MKQSFVLISGIAEQDLQNALLEFVSHYADFPFAHQIQLLREKGGGQYLIIFASPPSFTHLSFCVNYIWWGKSEANPLSGVFGYYYVSGTSERFEFLVGDFVKVYVARNDTAYDNVNVVNGSNQSWLYDFGGKVRKLATTEQPFEIPEVDLLNYNHIVDIIPAPPPLKPWWKFW